MALEINKVTNANIYVNGDSLLGKAKEIELPTLKQMTADHEALGMVGKVALFSGIDKLEGKIEWNAIYKDVMKLVADPTKSHQIQVRANLETHDSSGLASQVPAVAYLTVRFRGLPMGNFKQHENVELSSEYDCYYAKYEIDGEEMFEFDPMANIYKVGGVDILATYRNNIGG